MNVFSWDIAKAIANFEKHGVPFEEAATVFGDANGLDGEDPRHSTQERRRRRIGQSIAGRILLVVYTVRRMDDEQDEKEAIRIISARQASRREREAYAGFRD